MKTKVAEALMYGKRIIGTPEAFSGYENVAGAAGWVCTTKEDFAAALRQVREAPPPRFDPALRALYEQHYSRDAARRRLAEILAIPAPGR
jgi:glycosyltransferase involved in cell wall biosynthesis